MESAGTLKMFALYQELQEVLQKGSVYFIDELNARLHPLLVRNFILIFLNPEINVNHAQLFLQRMIHGSFLISCFVEMKFGLRRKIIMVFQTYILWQTLLMKMVSESVRMKAMRRIIFLASMELFRLSRQLIFWGEMIHGKKRQNRRTKPRQQRRRIPDLGYYLIVTDTEGTERCYFNGLHENLPAEIQDRLVVKVIETKTVGLIGKCVEYTAYDAQYREPWIVLDRDQVKDFDQIISQAYKNQINVGWSNPCFEIWMFAYYGKNAGNSGILELLQ